MRKNRLRKSVLVALAPVGASLVATSIAGAQTATYSNTYDTAASITAGPPNFNPTIQNWRFEYGAPTPAANHSVAWTNTEDNTGNGGGSVKLSWLWNAASDGSGSAAFTADTFPFASGEQPGALVTNISFDLLVGPGSTPDTFGGYGYFQVFARNESYNGFSQSFGNVELGSPGVWQTFDFNIATPIPVRALTFQDFNDSTRNINGPENWYVDNMSITYEVPEPASLGLLGVGLPALLMRRRAKKAKTG